MTLNEIVAGRISPILLLQCRNMQDRKAVNPNENRARTRAHVPKMQQCYDTCIGRL